MNRIIRRFDGVRRRIFGGIVVTAIALAASPLAQAETPPPVIRIGIASPSVGNPPVYTTGTIGLSRQRGLFEEEFAKDGVKVEWFFHKGAGPAVNEGLANKQFDFVFQGDLPSIIGRSGGLKTRFLLPTDSRQNLYLAVPPDSPIKSVKDLRGKRVAIFKGTNAQLPANRLLEANGLTERDLKVVNLDNATAQAALASKDIDAVLGGFEYLRLRDKGVARIVYSSVSDPRFTRRSGLLVTEEFAERYPETTTRVVKVVLRSARWASDEKNRGEVFGAWSLMGYPAEVYQEDFIGQPTRVRLSPLIDPFIIQRYKEAVEDSYRFRLTRSKFDVEKWFEPKFLRAALKELNLENYWTPTDANGKPVAAVAAR
ncbi:ABC transporter substrate-binding protein [Uliginosibacterium sp. sgz301328]|uniref:ABC transporter substrate-binding protein n=1 Tax=Uliginosibacterium sp. sgz301328 TaxID=3243764 RepID=UPI00359DBD7A